MNIDKDIEIVKEIIAAKDDYTVYFGHWIAKPYLVGTKKIQAIENVLSDRENWKKIAEKLAEELTKLTEENKEYYLDWAKKEVEK